MNKFFLFLISSILFCLTLSSVEFESQPKKKILVGSPIRQHPQILQEFLDSLERLEKTSYTFDYCFVDDNNNSDSKAKLEEFAAKHGESCLILSSKDSSNPILNHYICTENTHAWTNELIWKVADFKDRIIQRAIEKQYDYLFLIDSDLVLHPKTLEQLIQGNKGILCNIFWTSWQPGTIEMPQVWLQDQYNFYELAGGQKLTEEEIQVKSRDFMNQLRQPGIYEVGGLGACTLIDRATLLKGVSFKKIKNVSFWGEDRHFCIRAAALGIPLYVDTHYPAYHIYRISALPGVEQFKKDCEKELDHEKPYRLTLSMIIKNEANNYLRPVLEKAKEYITHAVIIDDGSTDESAEVCKEVLASIPLTLIVNQESKFANECTLREQQWNETIKTNPDWILCLDADEMFEDRFKDEIVNLLSHPVADLYSFRLYDFWDENHYRSDRYWQAHNVYRPFLVKYKPEITYTFQKTAQHCGRFPLEIHRYPNSILSNLRLKHYGWAKEKDRVRKYKRYQELDPNAKYGWKEQYESILDPQPHLEAWIE